MSNSRDGDRERIARTQSGETKPRRESEKVGKGVTRITEDNDPIAAALRRVYEDAATEPLPDDLSRLLSQLEAAEKDA